MTDFLNNGGIKFLLLLLTGIFGAIGNAYVKVKRGKTETHALLSYMTTNPPATIKSLMGVFAAVSGAYLIPDFFAGISSVFMAGWGSDFLLNNDKVDTEE